jgi:hypothetical protein
MRFAVLFIAGLIVGTISSAALAADIVHDSEYYVLEAQNAKKWAADDKLVNCTIDFSTSYRLLSVHGNQTDLPGAAGTT